MAMKHPFVWGAVTAIVGFVAWRNRGRIVALARKIRHPLSGLGDDRFLVGGGGNPAIAIRQLRRYTFASMQDQSPIVGITHASYALMALDLLEETVGRDAIKSAGYDPTQVRALVTKLQDMHAEKLRACDPYLAQVLNLERKEGSALPGFVFAGGAPTGA